MREISIGALARQTGVKVPTIRYYEQIGLLPVPPRTGGKQRRYTPEAVARLAFIRHARTLGFEVDAIRELLAISTKPNQSCAEADRIARRHVAEVDRRIAELVAHRATLEQMITRCGQGIVSECLILETLAHPKAHVTTSAGDCCGRP